MQYGAEAFVKLYGDNLFCPCGKFSGQYTGTGAYLDYTGFIVCSGRGVPQVKALSDELEEKAAEMGLIPRRKEGYQEGRWIVLDFGDLLVHLFHPEERTYYNLERLWDDGRNVITYTEEGDAK